MPDFGDLLRKSIDIRRQKWTFSLHGLLFCHVRWQITSFSQGELIMSSDGNEVGSGSSALGSLLVAIGIIAICLILGYVFAIIFFKVLI
jgi:hypothetical protein